MSTTSYCHVEIMKYHLGMRQFLEPITPQNKDMACPHAINKLKLDLSFISSPHIFNNILQAIFKRRKPTLLLKLRK